jgi:hypothetical protein
MPTVRLPVRLGAELILRPEQRRPHRDTEIVFSARKLGSGSTLMHFGVTVLGIPEGNRMAKGFTLAP